jgi:ATPase subunit of ABC transporter with duplicated ATPase domains
MMLVIAAVVILVLVVVGIFYVKSSNDTAEKARIAAETEQKAHLEEQKAAEARLHDMQAKAEAEAAQLKKQAEAERLLAIEQARKQAEEQTRQQLSQQFDTERKTKFPGILIVTTQPSGAAVTIDNDLPRTSPLSLNTIQPGKHRVSIALRGYDTLETVADVVGGETTDMGMIQLEKAAGSVDISSTPADVQYALRVANALPGSPRSGPAGPRQKLMIWRPATMSSPTSVSAGWSARSRCRWPRARRSQRPWSTRADQSC